jgi:hypothetical protein
MFYKLCHISIVFLIGLSLCLHGCDEKTGDGVAERLSGPEANSALPMRIDATVTPTVTVTPHANETTTSQQEPYLENPEPENSSELETRLNLLDAVSETPLEQAPVKHPELSSKAIELVVSLTPSPVPTPIPTILGSEEIQASQPESQQKPTPEKIQQPSKSVAAQETPKEKVVKTAQETPLPPASPTEEAPKRNNPKSPSPSITLDKIAVCSKISNRKPSGISDSFSFAEIKKIYTWMKISGAKPPMTVKHLYYREEQLVATVRLTIKYPSMRTWSQKTLKAQEALGKWRVLITTEDEKETLAMQEFTVVP